MATSAFEWDDRLWEQVWDRTLGPAERFAIGRDVWRRRVPDDRFHARVAVELARRWRTRAVVLASVYALWVAFWGTLLWSDLRADGALKGGLHVGAVVVGIVAIGACVASRRWLRDQARRQV
jgi:hypothetical protein